MYSDKHNKDEYNFSFASTHTVTSLLAPVRSDTKQASFDRLEYGNR